MKKNILSSHSSFIHLPLDYKQLSGTLPHWPLVLPLVMVSSAKLWMDPQEALILLQAPHHSSAPAGLPLWHSQAFFPPDTNHPAHVPSIHAYHPGTFAVLKGWEARKQKVGPMSFDFQINLSMRTKRKPEFLINIELKAKREDHPQRVFPVVLCQNIAPQPSWGHPFS